MSQNNFVLPELLCPVGDWERLEAAIMYGADAVYLGSKQLGMRAASPNFDFPELKKAVEFAHKNNTKVYLTCNTIPTNDEVEELPDFLKNASLCNVDALIIADIGILMQAKKIIPDMEIHISTQTGIMNYVTATELYNLGAKRVVLARELSFTDIRRIKDKIPSDLEIECFVHGAMCMSISGRCLLSQYLAGRDANRGNCVQPCRWKYHLMEETRPGQFFPVFEDDKGSYILNAKDMCMIEYINKLTDAGISSLKIEGRQKATYYVAIATNAYRSALDSYDAFIKAGNKSEEFVTPKWITEEVYKISHRQYTPGFYFGRPEDGQNTENGSYVRHCDVIAMVDEYKNGRLYCTQRNRFFKDDEAEIVEPGLPPVKIKLEHIFDEDDCEINIANRGQMKFSIPIDRAFAKNTIIRKNKDNE